MKRIIKLVTVMLIIAISCVMMFGCKKPVILATADNPFALAGLNVRPAGAKSVIKDVNVEGQDAINLAVELYELASNNDKNVSHRAFYSVCPTNNVAMKMNNKILLNILEIKNADEYYRIDYRLKEDVELFNRFSTLEKPINEAIKLVTTERRYMKTDMDYTRYQMVTNALTDINGVPYADWSDTAKIDEKVDPAQGPSKPKLFSASQEGEYRKSDHIIDTDTILSAVVTYDEVKGVYKVSLELDCTIVDGVNKATQNTRPLIQDGSGADNAKYDQILIEFEIWDNGYFKEFKSTEYWSAQMKIVMTLDITSEFLYHDVYSYDINDCNISKYYAGGQFIDDYNVVEE